MRFTKYQVKQLTSKMKALYNENWKIAAVAGITRDGKLTASNVVGGETGFAERVGFIRPDDLSVQSLASSLRMNGHIVARN